jgi:WbqC-like protein family
MNAFSATASTAVSSAEDPPTRPVAIHQPNLFPRLSTVAKLFAAAEWIVLDEVQFVRRDYQHRARLAPAGESNQEHLLTFPVHLPTGRSTRICDVRLVDPSRSARNLDLLSRQLYRRGQHWKDLEPPLHGVVEELQRAEHLGCVSVASTVLLLRALGWHGEVVRTRGIPTRNGRTDRLVDLTLARAGTHYLCGTGGLRYLDQRRFTERGIDVIPCRTPERPEGLWAGARRISALWAIGTFGTARVRETLTRHRDTLLTSPAATASVGARLPPLPAGPGAGG